MGQDQTRGSGSKHAVYSDGSDTSHDQHVRATDQYVDSPKDLDGDGTADVDRAATKQDLTARRQRVAGDLSVDLQMHRRDLVPQCLVQAERARLLSG